MRVFVTAAILAVVSVIAVTAQVPKPKPLPQKERPVLPAQILLVIDEEVSIAIDAAAPVRVRPGRHRFPVTLGAHYIELRSIRAGDVSAQHKIDIQKPGQEILTVSLKAKVEEALSVSPASFGRAAQPGLTLLLIEPALRAAVLQHLPSIRAAKLDLEFTPAPFNGRPLPPVIQQQVHAELFESAAPAVTAAKVNGFDMQSCAVTIGVRWTGTTPEAFSMAGSGAAFAAPEACEAARTKAVTNALTQLIRTVRKEGR